MNRNVGGSGRDVQKLGERLLKEIETEDMSSVRKILSMTTNLFFFFNNELLIKNQLLNSLREFNTSGLERKYFNIPELDALLASQLSPPPLQPRQQDNTVWNVGSSSPPRVPQPPQSNAPAATKTHFARGPILEFISPPHTHHPSGSGKTHLIYLLITLTILPRNFNSILLDGQNSAIVLFDPLSHFSVPRLAAIMLSYIIRKYKEEGRALDDESKRNISVLVKRSLVHVHIFRPQSWDSVLATLRGLPEYLFDARRHSSIDRRIHSIILEDIDAFAFHIRYASTNSSTSANTKANPLATASAKLTLQLERLSTLLSCALILTSHSVTPTGFRPALPNLWPSSMQVTRLALRRVEVLKFAPGLSIEEAEVERAQRWEVVARGRFECWKVGSGIKDWEGFTFRIRKNDVEVEREESS